MGRLPFTIAGGSMERFTVVGLNLILVLFAAAILVPAQSAPQLDDDAIQTYLRKIHDQRGMMNVPQADGKFLHDLIVKEGYKRGLEIGTSNGYSGIWIGLAMRKTNGKLITLEIDQGRASLARENFGQVKLEKYVELREGDALEIIPQLEGPFDFVFIDAWKPDYTRYFHLVFPKLSPGGVIVAHNVLSHGRDMRDFLDLVQNHPELETHIERLSSAGLSVSFKHN
jgi:predicted O-methyltransferase YrrM